MITTKVCKIKKFSLHLYCMYPAFLCIISGDTEYISEVRDILYVWLTFGYSNIYTKCMGWFSTFLICINILNRRDADICVC